MNIVPWRRQSTLDSFRSEFEDLLGRVFDGEPANRLPALFSKSVHPAVNLSETDKSWNLSFELPGLDAKDINVQIVGRQLVVSGERKWEEEKKNREFHRVESQFGSFQRAVALPENVRLDPDGIVATYKRGILEVTLPKVEPTPAAKIAVKPG